ncbi:hypothetical protein LLH00_07440 [bacterium]|nr:hypothetical protein [bacterium]
MSLWKKLLFSLLPLVVIVLLGESACRIKYYRAHEDGLPYLLAPFMWKSKVDVINIPQVIRVNAPRDTLIYSPCSGESLPQTYHQINGFTWRGKAFQPLKADGTYRILTVGGSTVESRNNADEETWSAQLETMLNDSTTAGVHYEVINGGKVGYNSESVFLHLQNYGFALQPDMVIYYEAYNDVNKGLLDKKIGLLGRSTFGWLHRRLYFSSMLYTYLVQKWHYRQADRMLSGGNSGRSGEETRLIEQGMRQIIQACRERSIQFVYVRQAIDFPLGADSLDLTDRATLEGLLSGSLKYSPELNKLAGSDNFPLKQRLVNTIQTDFCRAAGVPVIDPLPSLDVARSEGQHLFTDIVHKTCFAERILARVIRDNLPPVLQQDPAWRKLAARDRKP